VKGNAAACFVSCHSAPSKLFGGGNYLIRWCVYILVISVVRVLPDTEEEVLQEGFM